MATRAPHVRASGLPTKRIRAADGTVVRMKVVQSDSDTLANDLLAAFRSNVRRIKQAQRDVDRVGQNPQET